jgi:hypothetical protein
LEGVKAPISSAVGDMTMIDPKSEVNETDKNNI